MLRFSLPLGLVVLFSNPAISQTMVAAPDAALSALVQETKLWTLADSVRRVHDIAPELRAAEAEIAAREAELVQADAWPNPTVDIRADNRLQNESGSNGTNLTQIALSQPLPLRRIARQRAVAEANLESARANLRYQQLLLEREVARVFLALQLTAAKRQLAKERLSLVAESPGTSRKKGTDRLVRYLTPLERQRLAILNEEAAQALAASEREQEKALIDFRALLALPSETQVELVTPVAPATPASLDILVRTLDTHPALATAQKEADAAQAGIAVAESQRFADPALNLFRERDYYLTGQRDVTGVGVSVQIPFWNTSRGVVAKAESETVRAQAQLEMLKRNTRNRLEQARTDLLRLLDQTERLRVNLLEPAREVFTLTRRGFASGELNVLSLVDANNTYFDARTRYLELQQESALAAADLRLASGISVLDSSMETLP